MSVIDQLVNLKKVKLNHCLGIFISREYAYVAEVRYSGKTVKVERYLKVPMPDSTEGRPGETMRIAAMNVDFFERETGWLPALQSAMSQVKWGTSKVVVTLSSQFGVFRNFFMPRIEARFWRTSIPLEAKKYVPFAFEGAVYDFYGYDAKPAADGKERMSVLFAITNKKICDAVAKGMQKLGLEVMGLELAPISAERLFDIMGDNASGQVHAHFDASISSLQVSCDGIPFLFREVNFNDVQSTERRKLDVKGSIDFVARQVGADAFKGVKLSGENLDLWKVVIEEDAKLPVTVWDPKTELKVSELEWGLISSIGACARYMVPNKDYIDLSGAVKETPEEVRAMVLVWCVAILVSVGFLASSLFSHFQAGRIQKKLQHLQTQKVTVPELEGKSSAQITDAVKEIRSKADSMSIIFDKTIYATPVVSAIGDAIPENVWLTRMDFSTTLQVLRGHGGDANLSLGGYMRAGNSQKDIDSVFKFKESLMLETPIKALCAKGGFSVTSDITPGSAEAAAVDNSAVAPSAPVQSSVGKAGKTDSMFSMQCVHKPED